MKKNHPPFKLDYEKEGGIRRHGLLHEERKKGKIVKKNVYLLPQLKVERRRRGLSKL